jgi:hypothetical protein
MLVPKREQVMWSIYRQYAVLVNWNKLVPWRRRQPLYANPGDSLQ